MTAASADRRYKRPESVLVVVYTSEGEALLIRRADRPDFWQSVTGSLGWGESPAAAARRELAEETGIRGTPASTGMMREFEILPDWSARFPPDACINREHEFRFELAGRRKVTLNQAEHDACTWVGVPEAAERVWSWTNREALLRLAAEKGWTR